MEKKSTWQVVAVSIVAVILILGVTAWIGANLYVRSKAKKLLADVERDSKGLVKVEVGEISANPFLWRVTLSDVEVVYRTKTGDAPSSLHFDQFRLIKWMSKNNFAVDFEGLSSPQWERFLDDPSVPAKIKTILAPPIQLSGEISTRYIKDPSNEVNCHIGVRLRDTVKFDFDLHVTELNLAAIENAIKGRDDDESGSFYQVLKTQIRFLVLPTKIHRVRIALANKGLIKAVMEAIAERLGKTPDQYIEEQIQIIQAGLRSSPAFQRFDKPLVDFVRNPNSIELIVEPQPPLNWSEMVIVAEGGAKPEALVERLGVTLNVNTLK